MPLIVIDGLDGSGKTTQTDTLCNRLSQEKINHTQLTFPDYDGGSAELVKMYQSGGISKNADDVNAYAASSFYAADRYICFFKRWRGDYESGKLIITCRYTTSNQIYQSSKLPEKERESYNVWLEDFEYIKLGLPKPDLVIYLDLSAETALGLIGKRGLEKEIHETDEFLRKARSAALYMVRRNGWHTIKCEKSGIILPKTEISNLIYKEVMRFV